MKIDSYIKEQFGIKNVDIRTYSPLTLAYIGDGIFDIVFRSVVVGKGNTKANLLHKHTSNIVKSQNQALKVEALFPPLTKQSSDQNHRGRNAKSPSMAKNATMADYRKATGLVAVMGYLYLKDDFERVVSLTKLGVELLGIEI